MKKVSVIIPLYNEEKYIKECVLSVVNQTYKNIEIIVIDDKSTDNSLQELKKIKDKRIKIIDLNKNKGVSNARNIGIKESKGEYICFLDSDDFWVKDKLEKQVRFIKNKEFIYSDYMYINKNGEPIKRVDVPDKLTYKDALKNTCIFTGTVMFDMKKISKKDLDMPNLQIGEDTYVWWNVLKKGITAYGMNEVLSYYRIKGKSLSSNKFKAVICAFKLYSLQELKVHEKVYYFSNYLISAINRRIK